MHAVDIRDPMTSHYAPGAGRSAAAISGGARA